LSVATAIWEGADAASVAAAPCQPATDCGNGGQLAISSWRKVRGYHQ
jgi:hypothetical protein